MEIILSVILWHGEERKKKVKLDVAGGIDQSLGQRGNLEEMGGGLGWGGGGGVGG